MFARPFVLCLVLPLWCVSTGRAQPLDRHGDPLPPDAVARLGTIRLATAAPHFTIRFTPDGKIVTGCGPVVVSEVATGKVLRRIDVVQKGYVGSFDVSRDGKLLATVDSKRVVNLWELATGKRLWSATDETHNASAVAFAPDGNTVVTGCYNQTLRWWDLATGRQVRRLGGLGQEIYYLAFTPDGKTLVTGGRAWSKQDTPMCLRDVESGKPRWLHGHTGNRVYEGGGVSGISLSRDGKQLASAGWDGTVRVWDVATAKELHCLKGHGGAVLSVAFDRDGKRLVSGGSDHTVRIWDAATGKELFRLDRPRASIKSIAFSPDGTVLAVGGFVVHLWDWTTGKELRANRGHHDEILSVAAIPGRAEVLTAGHDGIVRRWDPLTGEERPPLANLPNRVRWVAASPDGRRLAIGETDGTVRVYDTTTRKELHRLRGPGDHLRALAFTSDGTGRLVAGGEKSLFFWDSDSGKLLHSVKPESWCDCWAVSPNGRHVAGGTGSGVIVFDLATGRALSRAHGEMYAHHRVPAVDFSPDSRLLVSGDWSGHLMLWEVATGKTLWDIHAHDSCMTSVAFSPDGRTIASGNYDGTVGLWETATGGLRQRFAKHDDLVFSVAFAARGRLLVSGGRDCTGLVWDVTGRQSNGRLPPLELSPADLDALWAELAGADAAQAHRAMWKLASAPGVGLPFLRKRLQAPPLADSKRLARLLDDLASPDAEVADKAARELEYLGDAAAPLLREVLKGNPPNAARGRLELLLKKAEAGVMSPHRVRQLRALEVIEHVGGTAAREAVEAIRTDPGDVFLTREAEASLGRLKSVP